MHDHDKLICHIHLNLLVRHFRFSQNVFDFGDGRVPVLVGIFVTVDLTRGMTGRVGVQQAPENIDK